MIDTALDSTFKEIQHEYLEFFEDTPKSNMKELITDMIRQNKKRFIVNLNALREMNPSRCNSLLGNAQDELIMFQKAFREIVTLINPTFSAKSDELLLGFEGSFGSRHVSPRTLNSQYLGNMICCEGIVTKCSLVRPKVSQSVHYCPKTNKTLEQKYSDLTSLEPFPTSTVYPTKDVDGNPLETEFGLSIFKDHQTFTIQEMPEKAPAGQLPRSAEVIVENELVDFCKPGDRVQIIGLYRCLPTKKSNFLSGTFKTVIIANNIKIINKEIVHEYSEDEMKLFRNFSRSRRDIFSLLAHSLAPSIYGHEYIKKAILCQLVGGTEKILENGTRLRGDINILLIGDPSTAKSQMLRYVLHASPRAIPTTGRGSTGVGLTAAVTSDPETGDRRLEAGAMVLADRGIVCIDEFDKMSDIDRTAIHEVMEQGRVTISKAGIHARLNARCSVLAAANPVYGRYDEYKTPMENIGMQDSLLSRFDLLFIVLDNDDTSLAKHVLKMHQYRAPNEHDGEVFPLGDNSEFLSTHNLDDVATGKDTQIYEKNDAKLYGTGSRKEKFVRMDFLNRYIHLAKQIKPELTSEAIDLICKAYTELRSRSSSTETVQRDTLMAKTMPVTARSLETLIRLATAHAKVRLSKTIDKNDAKFAVELVEKKKKKGTDKYGGSDDDDVLSSESEYHDVPEEQPKKAVEIENDPDNTEVSGNIVSIDNSKMESFKVALFDLFTRFNSQTIELEALVSTLSSPESNFQMSRDEIVTYLLQMQNENRIMLVEGVIYLV